MQQLTPALRSRPCSNCVHAVAVYSNDVDIGQILGELTLALRSLLGGIQYQALEGPLCRCGLGKVLLRSWQHMSQSAHSPAAQY